MVVDLKFDHVSKRYEIRQEPGADDGLGWFSRKAKAWLARPREFWAVRDVCFEVQRGEALGIIGHNGAGKSTILKMLSSITTPTSGEIIINGRLAALIEVGSGFHPELTGRENIYLNGAILGMSRREITEKLEEIIDFAEIRAFVDTPVKRFSSGMYVRLGFSIAAHLNPDILLLDEVLAVGDASFQAKCIKRVLDLKRSGKTIVFVSHDLGAVERLCDRAILMHRGQVSTSGPPRDVILAYEGLTGAFVPSAAFAHHKAGKQEIAEISSVSFSNPADGGSLNFQTGGPLEAHVEYEVRAPVDDAVVELYFFSQDGALRCQLSTELSGQRMSLAPGKMTVTFRCPEVALLPGIYHIDAKLKERNAPENDHFDWKYRCTTLRVDPGKMVHGEFYMPHEWSVVRGTPAYAIEPAAALVNELV